MEGSDRRVRVCMLIPKLKIGGAEMQVLYLANTLDRSRFSVSVCCLIPGDDEMEREAKRHVESLYCVGFRWRFLLSAFVRLVRYLKRQKFDILHCHLPLADSIGRIAGRFARIPVLITTEHGKHLWKNAFHLMLDRLLNGVTDARICVSRDIMEIRARREKTHWQKLKYIPNAVDPSRFEGSGRGRAAVMAEFGWSPADPFVVSVGRLVSAKNYPLLVEAIARLRKSVPNVRCLIVGEGDRRKEIAGRIDSLDVGEQVTLAGARTDIPDLLAAADVFVLSSIREGLPVSLLEAMASGKAIAATAVGGMTDAITDGENGLLVPAHEPQALVSAIGKLIGSIELRKRLGGAALQTVEERFSIHQTVKQTGEIYDRLFDEKKRFRSSEVPG